MRISNQYVVLKKFEEPKAEGFSAVEPGDSFTYKGVVVKLPDEVVFVSNKELAEGDAVIFAKHSPDTFDVEDASLGGRVKFVKRSDILAVI